MTVTSTTGGILITGDDIGTAQLMAIKGAVKLEASGMRRRGKSAKRIACEKLGLDKRTSYDNLVGALQKEIDKRMASKLYPTGLVTRVGCDDYEYLGSLGEGMAYFCWDRWLNWRLTLPHTQGPLSEWPSMVEAWNQNQKDAS